ncbi:arylesterase [Bernardetia sp.]|uniref:arylesterase n=1 Tax=Bernardetia sp. TaxID=1937974 RepID=UPI0025C5F2CF|nr:arylesterase [Bernardetia sp.]
MKNILFFGNSLTEGYGLTLAQAPPALLQKKIDEYGLPYLTINAGISGDTTHGAIMRLPNVLQQQEVDIFVLELGINDLFRGIPPQKMEQNLIQIIERTKVQYPTVLIVLVRVELPLELLMEFGMMGQVAAQYIQSYQSVYEKLAKKYNLPLIPSLLDGVMGETHLNLPDRLHPNAEGYKIVAETMWKTIYPILRQTYTN